MKNWRNILSVVEVAVILICVIILIVVWAGKPNNKIEESAYKPKNRNGLIKESYAQEYLNKFVDELVFSGYINEKSEKYIEKNYALVTPNFFGKLTDNDKLYIALSFLSNDKQELTKENVLRKYNEYFNEEPDLTNVNGCKTYIYNKDKEIYQESGTCNSSSADNLMIFKKDYERKNEMGYATIYIGLKNSQYIYTDLEKTNTFATQDVSNFAINDENYESFSKYKITFKEKGDSLYYFFSIEKDN